MYPIDASSFEHYYKFAFKSKFLKYPSITNWRLVYQASDKGLVDIFTADLNTVISEGGYPISAPKVVAIQGTEWSDWEAELKSPANTQEVEFIVFVLPRGEQKQLMYRNVKRLSTVTYGIPCQVIHGSTIKEAGTGQDLRNINTRIVAQIAAKLGGSPWFLKDLPFSERPSTVVGINVRWMRLERKFVVSMVASTNKLFSRYASNFAICGSQAELGPTCKALFVPLMEGFVALHKNNPYDVVLLRDGAAQHGIDEEIAAIREGVAELRVKL